MDPSPLPEPEIDPTAKMMNIMMTMTMMTPLIKIFF
jgi:hypothetical protein